MSIIPQLKQADINLPSDSNICFPFIHSQKDVVEYVSENEKVKKKEKKNHEILEMGRPTWKREEENSLN